MPINSRLSLSYFLASLAATPMAMADVPVVVTDFMPVTSLVSAVMGDLGTPIQLLELGADPHDLALRPSQMAAVSDADLVVWIGPELTPALERAVSVTTGTQLALLSAAGTETRAFGSIDDHAHEEGHDEDGHDEEGHDHTGIDPHAWLDPQNAIHWLGLIATELSRIDPANTAIYSANADKTAAALTRMQTDIAAILAPVQDRSFVTFHDAYGYFTGAFDLNFAGALSLGDATAPGAARIRALQDQIASDHVVCVFPEQGHDPALLNEIMQGSDARSGSALDPEGLTMAPSPVAYEGLMRGLAATLAACLTP